MVVHDFSLGNTGPGVTTTNSQGNIWWGDPEGPRVLDFLGLVTLAFGIKEILYSPPTIGYAVHSPLTHWYFHDSRPVGEKVIVYEKA